MYKRRNLTGFFVFYIALGVIVYLILRFAYGEPFFNVFKLGYAHIALGIFFYDTVYAKYNKLGLFEVDFNFDRTAALLLSKSVFKRFLLFLKYFGFVERKSTEDYLLLPPWLLVLAVDMGVCCCPPTFWLYADAKESAGQGLYSAP
ncbi:MAG: hypothetical protein ACOCNA_04435 [Prevotella pectinovora]